MSATEYTGAILSKPSEKVCLIEDGVETWLPGLRIEDGDVLEVRSEGGKIYIKSIQNGGAK